jgi:hypothetical protein
VRNLFDVVRGSLHPEGYHGRGASRPFFEGWYVKLVDRDRGQRWAVIPGIFLGSRATDSLIQPDEAFVQILNGTTGESWYHRFPVSEFDASATGFDVRVGPNRFTEAGIHLETPQLTGDVRFASPLDPWPITLAEPGIMGWYGHVPFMECFHGVVSFGHELSGSLEIGGSRHDFGGGRGYIEKDWGKAFPEGYLWLASNHIDTDPSASLIGSVAIIPWLGGAFRGFVVGLKHGGSLHRWTTYNGSKQRELSITDSRVRWSLTGPDGLLELEAARVRGGILKAPHRHAMLERVEETLDATVTIRHTDPHGTVVLEGNGFAAGLEVVGDIERLIGLKSR